MVTGTMDSLLNTGSTSYGISRTFTDSNFDTIIVGGGVAGIGAAIGARQADPSAHIVVIELEGCLGGAATHRGVNSFCGIYTCNKQPKRAVGAIWDEVHSRLVKEKAASLVPDQIMAYVQNFEPEGLKHVFDELLLEHRITVILHATVVGADRKNNRITSVEIQERRGRRTLYASTFVDCSGDGDLSWHAGASTRYGNHGHVNLGSLATRFGGLANANPSSRAWQKAIIAAKEANPVLKKIIPRNVGVLIKLPQSGDIVTYMASASYDARDSVSISNAEQQGRMQAKIYLDILRKLPGHENMYLVSSGPNFGTRESRHVNARYQLQESDIMSSRQFEDTVAIGGWYLEWHDETKEDWPILFTAPPDGVFQIPLRSLWSVDTDNLFVAGRCADGDRGASSAIRVLGTALATGQAAGVAAGLSISCLRAGRDLNPKHVQGVLLKHGAFLDPEILPPAVKEKDPGERNPLAEKTRRVV